MSLAVRSDTTQLMKSIEALKRQQTVARQAQLTALANNCAKGFEAFTPEDTGRLKKAWLEACGEVGADSAVLPSLKPSRRADRIYQRIRGQWINTHIQRVKLETLFNKWYPDGRKLGEFGQRMKRDLAKVVKREGKLKEQYDLWKQADQAPVIMIGRGGGHKYATLRTKVYGGRGAIRDHGERSELLLHNQEPHASIVDSNTGMKSKVARYLKMFGGKQLESKYRTKLAEARKMFEK